MLQDAPLEFVVAQVLGKGARSGAPPVLTKRQFLSLAHVAEVAQVRVPKCGLRRRPGSCNFSATWWISADLWRKRCIAVHCHDTTSGLHLPCRARRLTW